MVPVVTARRDFGACLATVALAFPSIAPAHTRFHRNLFLLETSGLYLLLAQPCSSGGLFPAAPRQGAGHNVDTVSELTGTGAV